MAQSHLKKGERDKSEKSSYSTLYSDNWHDVGQDFIFLCKMTKEKAKKYIQHQGYFKTRIRYNGFSDHCHRDVVLFFSNVHKVIKYIKVFVRCVIHFQYVQ